MDQLRMHLCPWMYLFTTYVKNIYSHEQCHAKRFVMAYDVPVCLLVYIYQGHQGDPQGISATSLRLPMGIKIKYGNWQSDPHGGLKEVSGGMEATGVERSVGRYYPTCGP